MPDCFISYTSEDEELAKAIKEYLQKQGVSVFLASVSIQPGDDWTNVIKINLQNSPWILFLASHEACTSPYVNQELGGALFGQTQKRLVPVVWNMPPENLPGWVDQKQALDLRGLDPESVARQLDHIAERVKASKRIGTLVTTGIIGALLWAFVRN